MIIVFSYVSSYFIYGIFPLEEPCNSVLFYILLFLKRLYYAITNFFQFLPGSAFINIYYCLLHTHFHKPLY